MSVYPAQTADVMRPLTADMPTFKTLSRDDLPMVHDWLRRPHVAEWWHDPPTLVGLERDYLPRGKSASSTRAYIALLGGQPIGFIQSYVALGSGGGWWEHETDPGTRGIDQFLANLEQLGSGLGSTMVNAFVQKLFADPAVTKVQTDPSPDNERAIRCYRRAGLLFTRRSSLPTDPHC